MWWILGINILLGIAAYFALLGGMLPLCLGTFMALGGITGSLACEVFHLPPASALLIAGVIGAASAIAVAVGCGPLRGFAFALATIAIAQTAECLVTGSHRLGGAVGFVGGDSHVIRAWLIPVVLTIALGCYAFEHTPLRRALTLLRKDEQIATSQGIAALQHRALALAVSGAIAGMAGVFYLSLSSIVEPQLFGMSEGISIITLGIIGGTNSFWGSAVGALIQTVGPELLRSSRSFDLIREGLCLLLVVIFLPEGVAGDYLLILRRLSFRIASNPVKSK